MARSSVRKGGNFTAAMACQFAATNLVLVLGVDGMAIRRGRVHRRRHHACLLGAGYALLLPKKPQRREVEHAKGNAVDAMETHAAMAMERRSGNWRERLFSRTGWIAISDYYLMNWTMVWKGGYVPAIDLSMDLP